MIVLQNGCRVFLEAPHRTMENATVVMAEENGPLKVVCWVVDREGYAYWGAYGKESAERAFEERTVKTIDRLKDLRGEFATTPPSEALEMLRDVLDVIDSGGDVGDLSEQIRAVVGA